MSSLVFLEHHQGSFHPSTGGIIEAVLKLEPNQSYGLILTSSKDELNTLTSSLKKLPITSLKKIYHLSHDKLKHYCPEAFAPVLKSIIQKLDVSHFLASNTPVGKSILPRLAALLDVAPLSDIVEINDKETFCRPIYAGIIILFSY